MRAVSCLLVLTCLVGAGCGDDRSLHVNAWQLSVDGREGEQAVTLPTRFGAAQVPHEQVVYRLRTHVELPAELSGQPLRLALPDLATIVSLAVDGQPAFELSSSSATGYRRRGPLAWVVPASATADGAVDLELTIENRWYQSTWLSTVPRLVPMGVIDPASSAIDVFNLYVSIAALVALLQIGLTCMLIYAGDQRRREYFSFGVQALMAANYPRFVIGIGQSLFGVFDGPLFAMSLIVAVTASVDFTHELLELKRASRWWWRMCALSLVIAAVAYEPFVAQPVVSKLTDGFIGIVAGYQVFTLVRAVRRGHADRRGVRLLLTAWIVLAVTSVPDQLFWSGMGDVLGGVRVAGVGLAAFAMIVSFLLAGQFTGSLRRRDQLNVELATRVEQLEKRRTEIEQLNEELRRQIGDRSAQIGAALALARAGHTEARELLPGELVQNRYKVGLPIGSGGMGTVYEVTRIADGKRLALKLAREVDGESLARLAREAQMAATVAHENVVAIVDVDVATSGFLFLVMELVDGKSLGELRDHFGDVAWARPILRQVAAGLAAMHAAGVVHRDLKPGNLLLTEQNGGAPVVKISDFGIAMVADMLRVESIDGREVPAVDDTLRSPMMARVPAATPVPAPVPASTSDRTAATEAVRQRRPSLSVPSAAGKVTTSSSKPPHSPGAGQLTRTGFLPGTPAYIAPELALGRHMLSPAADMFALGVIARELMTRTRPFPEPAALAKVEGRGVPPPTATAKLLPDLAPALALAIDACLSMDPAERPTAAELAALLA